MKKFLLATLCLSLAGQAYAFSNHQAAEAYANSSSSSAKYEDCMFYRITGNPPRSTLEAEEICKDPAQQNFAAEGLRKWDTEYISDMLDWCERVRSTSNTAYLCPRHIGPDHCKNKSYC
jgi:hypothetical protein